MKNKESAKNDNEKYFIPEILKGGELFSKLAKSPKTLQSKHITVYRKYLYKQMDIILGDDKPSVNSYKTWFADPEYRVLGAFALREKDYKKFTKIITAMQKAMELTVGKAVQEASLLVKHYKEQSKLLSPYLELIEPKD